MVPSLPGNCAAIASRLPVFNLPNNAQRRLVLRFQYLRVCPGFVFFLKERPRSRRGFKVFNHTAIWAIVFNVNRRLPTTNHVFALLRWPSAPRFRCALLFVCRVVRFIVAKIFHHAEQPLAHVVGNGANASIRYSLSVGGCHAVRYVAHHGVNGYLVRCFAANGFKAMPQGVERAAQTC